MDMEKTCRRFTRVGSLVVDHERRQATVADDELYLSAREFDLLAVLAEDPQRLVTVDALLADAFGHGVGITRRTVEACAERVKRKLDLRGMPDAVISASGFGFRLLPVDEREAKTGQASAELQAVA